MGEPLKSHFGERIPRALARQIKTVWPSFRDADFLGDALEGYADLELMDRGRSIARSLARHLPSNYPDALKILMRSIDELRPGDQSTGGMAAFFFLPHTSFVAQSGIEHFHESMQAQYRLTQLFSAEFSIRPFIERYESESLALLRTWAADPNEHVRRLVSEGTRPRLPWGGRLRRFQEDPTQVIALLELLKDDHAIYVRRSVANNLNDIGKDHPDILLRVAEKWMKGASDERQALIKHALRSLVKQGNPDALELLGFGRVARVAIEDVVISPKRVAKGGKVTITFGIRSTSRSAQRVIVDMRVHFIKASGNSSPKVFKLKSMELSAGGRDTFRKTVTLADLTTRKHYPGTHVVDALVNGKILQLGWLTLLK